MPRKNNTELTAERAKLAAEEKIRWDTDRPARLLKLILDAVQTPEVTIRVRMKKTNQSPEQVLCYEFECYDLEYDNTFSFPFSNFSENECQEAEWFIERVRSDMAEKKRLSDLRSSALSKLSPEERKVLNLK